MEIRNSSSRVESDRLISLPDSLLCHILSFLPTKLSVATSVLSRRWKFLWTDVLNLDFDSKYHKRRKSGHGLRIADTISRVMLLSNVRDINTFRLIIKDGTFRKTHLDTWIRTTIARNVQALDIQLYHQVWLPRCLFTCNTLVDLRLHCCGSVPDSINLPNLKKLHLHYFQYGNDEKLQNLISGCPVLEELNIHKFNVFDLKHRIIISSPTIKCLTLNLGCFDLNGLGNDSEDDFCDYELEIYTPAVRCLVLEDQMSQRIATGKFNSMIEANIRLYSEEVKDDGVIYSSSVLDLVENLCQVKCLKLSIGYNQVTDDHLKRWTEPQKVPTCLSSQLKQVTIDPFEYLDDEYKILSYILRNGKVLNMMDIICEKEINTTTDIDAKCADLEKRLNALQRISAFERRSETCKLQFS
ncbi:hypothetical protein BUALT_Bualt01G0199800 [Buddleja alternifolia]|uniref:F-box domain-containing protein n=1 Tax=Buddleja alternifolia TaxID=168488 RepID=A0AAV6YJ18_9LAMI|nr:hypothetical protein BUALT_Bualt01G0199800 [Buddleja alternifolia]